MFKVGAVTIWSGNPFQEEITLTEKKFLHISFLQDFFFNLRAWPLIGFSFSSKKTGEGNIFKIVHQLIHLNHITTESSIYMLMTEVSRP